MPPPLPPILDHVVVNVLGRLDEVAEHYVRLGFRLTPRGHHSLGSSNNLAIFDSNYLELLGFLPGRGERRADLWSHPPGLTGLVFKAEEPGPLHARLRESGVPVLDPLSFSRPVELADGTEDARFTVVRIAGDAVANGRVFFCHHATPELVWRPEWQVHPNAATSIAEFVIVGRDPARTGALYEKMFGPGLLADVPGGLGFAAGTANVTILTPDSATSRFGEACPELPPDGSDRMVALVFRTASLAAARSVLDASGVAHRPFEGGVVVAAASAGQVALAFKGP